MPTVLPAAPLKCECTQLHQNLYSSYIKWAKKKTVKQEKKILLKDELAINLLAKLYN